MVQFRCQHTLVTKNTTRKCNYFLFEEDIKEGVVNIKCPSCGNFSLIDRKLHRKEKADPWFDNDKQKSDNKKVINWAKELPQLAPKHI